MSKSLLPFIAVFLASSVTAGASGFARDTSARTAGRAGAGFAATDTPAAFALNPAAAAFLKYRNLELGGRASVPFLSFAGEDPFPGSAHSESLSHAPIVAPSLYYTHAVTDRWVVGVGLDEPFAFDYHWSGPEDFSGRFLSQRSTIHSRSVKPVMAYKLADRLAIGAFLDVRRTTFRLERHLAGIQPFTQQAVDAAALSTGGAAATKLSGGVGILAKPSDSFSIGISYRHLASTRLEGQATITPIRTGDAQVDARFLRLYPASLPYQAVVNLPKRIGAGLAYEVNEWSIAADLEWTDWSAFGGGPILFPDRPDLSPELAGEWRDVFSYHIGAERPINESWTLRFGYAFNESPVTRESLGPFAPELRSHVAALGATWTRGGWHIDLANTLALSPGRTTAGTSHLLYDGRYHGLQDSVSVSIGYRY
jgi:long-chain fatty acid transport protein